LENNLNDKPTFSYNTVYNGNDVIVTIISEDTYFLVTITDVLSGKVKLAKDGISWIAIDGFDIGHSFVKDVGNIIEKHFS